MRIALVTLIN